MWSVVNGAFEREEKHNVKLKTYYQCSVGFTAWLIFQKISRNKFPSIEVKDYEDFKDFGL